MSRKKTAQTRISQERRQHPRVPVNIWVREERGDYYFLYKATDISVGGLFLEKKLDATPTNPIRSTFKFTLPKSSRLISAEGYVVYTRSDPNSPQTGSGIKFDVLSNQDRKLVVKFMKQHV